MTLNTSTVHLTHVFEASQNVTPPWLIATGLHRRLVIYQRSLASAVSPAMEIPTWLSTCRIFFWWAASSDWALCRQTGFSQVNPSASIGRCFIAKALLAWTHDWGVCKSTLRATRTAWVRDLSPTVAEPCFTASIAYSIWWMRPWTQTHR